MRKVWLGASRAAWRHGLIAGTMLSLLGALLCGLPQSAPLQEYVDLWLLFHLRGLAAPPADVIVVAIDPATSERVALPRNAAQRDRCEDVRIDALPETHEPLPPAHLIVRWPRCIHAAAVRALKQAGARVIGLDISFRPLPGSGSAANASAAQEQDRMLAQAISEANNVLVAQWLDPAGTESTVQRPAPVSAPIDAAALGEAPLRLTYGLNGRVNGFALFSEEEVPISSMPVLAFHLAAADMQPDLHRWVKRLRPDDADLIPSSAAELIAHPPLQAATFALRNLLRASAIGLPTDMGRPAPKLRALLDVYTGEPTRYLNFYGPAGTFPMVSYADVLADAQRDGGATFERIRGKTAIVGYVDLTTRQRDDHYPTVFSNLDGVKLSGTELLATAVANIETGSALQAASPALRIAIAIAFGLLLGPLVMTGTLLRAIAMTALLASAYLTVTLLIFRSHHTWLPVLVPILMQAPVALAYAVAHSYRDLQIKRDRLRALFGKFIPDAVIEGLLANQSQLDTVSEPVYGVCLVTDAERFTHLADTMHPAELARFLNEYFQVVFPRITEKDGSIIDVLGDAVLAFWKGAQDDHALHSKVCTAAIELVSAVDRFNAASATRLPTRIGISGGFVTTTAMGAFNHYEFRPVGETVVTSFRLQDLNKMLGTRMLAAEPVVRDAQELLVRDVGLFQLKNKTTATHVFEIMGEKGSASTDTLQLTLEFELALAAIRARRFSAALEQLRAMQMRFPDDGPTRFYVRWLTEHPGWDGSAIPQH
jgi:adenylate cyclase